MEKKKIYSAPVVEIERLAYEPIMGTNTGVTWTKTPDGGAKKHHWSDWDDDVEDVGQSAGTGKSALELPSGGKLWDD